MKNLKLFLFATLAMFVAITGVNAVSTCNKPGQQLEGVTKACAAAVDGLGYDSINDAWTKIHNNTGKTIELYQDLTLNTARTFTKDVEIVGNGHKVIFNNVALTIADKGSLTIRDAEVVASSVTVPFDVQLGGTLVLDNVTATTATTVLNNHGTVTVTGGTYTSSAASSALFNNFGTLSMTDAKVVAAKATGAVVDNKGVVTLTGLDVNAKTATLVNVASHNTQTNLVSGTYKLKTIVKESLTAAPNDLIDEVAAEVNISDGTYTTENQALYFDHGIKATIDGGTITVKSGTAVKIYCADVVVNGGTITTVKGYVFDTIKASDDDKAANASLTITGGNFVTNNKYVLHIGRARMTYAISGGVFEAKGDSKLPAIIVDSTTKGSTYLATTTDAEGNTTVAKAIAGILTGGKYLNNIIAGVTTNSDGATVDVSDQLIAEGYTVKVEDPYKLVVSLNPEPEKDPGESGDPAVTPENPDNTVADDTETPNTVDSIPTYLAAGAVSIIGIALLGFSIKKRMED